MAVDTSTVQIKIDVVDENSASTVKNVEENIQGLGAAGAGTGEKVAAGMDKIKGHSLTALDNVRLLRDDIGIRIPRSMEKAIASSKLLMTGINAVGGALLAIGAIDIGIRMVEGLKAAYDKYLSLTKAADDYYAEVAKHREEDFTNTHSIEDTRARISQLTDEVKRFDQAQREISSHGFWLNPHILTDIVQSHDIQQAIYDRKAQQDKLQEVSGAQQHELTLAAIDRDHSSAGMSGSQARDTNRDRKLAVDEENQKYEAAQDKLLHNTTSSDAGATKRAIEDAKTLRDAKAEAAKDERTQSRETMRMQAEARQVNLHGDALLDAQRNAALDQLKAKLRDTELSPIQYRKQAAAIDEKFDNERLRRLEEERRTTEELRGEAALQSFKGIRRTQAEGDLAIAKIRANPDLSDQAKEDRIDAEQMRVHYQMIEEQRSFSDEIDSIVDSSASHQVSGFGRIRAEATKELDALQRKFDDVYSQINRNTPDGARTYEAGLGDLHRGQEAIRAGANQQTADLARKNAEETEQLESQARAKFLSAEQQQTAAIATEYEQRLNKYREQLNQQEISEQDYNRRVAAAAELRDAEMVENAKRAREKMAGEFTSLFRSLDHPTEAFKALGEKAAGQAAAAMVQRMQGHFGMGAQMPAGATAGGGLWDKLMSRVAGAPGAPHVAAAHSAASDLASIKAITLATAEIHVQSATLSISASGMTSLGAAGSAGATTGRGGPSAVPGTAIGGGSTSLLGVPGSVFSATGISPSGFAGGTLSSSGGYASTGDTLGLTGGSGSAPEAKNTAATALGDVQQGVGLFKQAKAIFGTASAPGGSTTDALGDTGFPDPTSIFGPSQTKVLGPGANGGMLGGGGIMANAGGAAGGAMGLFSAYEGNGGIGGALGGAMSGMELGMSVGGPIGAAVGLVGGAILGAIGFGGREKARVYDLKTVRPRIANDMMAYQAGSMDYTSAYSDMQALDQEARKTLDAMGGAARGYYWDTINHEIKQAEGKLTAEQRAGRSQFTAQAAQYDIGADRIPRDGFAMLHQDERIVPSDQNERITRALEDGADSPKTMPVASNMGGDVHLHVHTMDVKGVKQFLFDNKHDIRAAYNASRAENSGGADA